MRPARGRPQVGRGQQTTDGARTSQAASLKLVDIGSDMGVGLGDSDQPSLSGSMRGRGLGGSHKMGTTAVAISGVSRSQAPVPAASPPSSTLEGRRQTSGGKQGFKPKPTLSQPPRQQAQVGARTGSLLLPAIVQEKHTQTHGQQSQLPQTQVIANGNESAKKTRDLPTPPPSEVDIEQSGSKQIETLLVKPPPKPRGRSPLPSGDSAKPVAAKSQNGSTNATAISHKPVLPNINDDRRIIAGSMDNLPKEKSSIVRIFLSSTFSDFKVERDALCQYAYPELRKFCSALNLEFQVADLRWGIPEDASNDHMIERLCINEVERCQRVSQGPYFVALLGDRYGYRPPPPEIDVAEFELILSAEGALDTSVLNVWYKKDLNAQPPVYVLQSIDSILTHYTDMAPEHRELRNAAVTEWRQTEAKICTVLRERVEALGKSGRMDKKAVHQYLWSVTEQEIDSGILQVGSASATCICVIRKLTGLENDIQNPNCIRFTDVSNSEMDKDAQLLLANLKDSKLATTLPSANLQKFAIPWLGNGVSLNDGQHAAYITSFVENFVTTMKEIIANSVESNKKPLKPDATNKTQPQQHKPLGPMPTNKPAPANFNGSLMLRQFQLGKQTLQQLQDDNRRVEAGEMPLERAQRTHDELDAEVLHHLSICRDKCKLFCGRDKQLAAVKQYLGRTKAASPLIIHAPSGQGKTAFLAKVASSVKQWCGGSTTMIVRFLGTSPTSSTLKDCLSSVCDQLATVYGDPFEALETGKFSLVVRSFNRLLNVASWHQAPSTAALVLLLDSIDQLTPENDPYSLSWLPKVLPDGVFVILSVLSEAEECLKNARTKIANKDSFLEIPVLDVDVLQPFSYSYLNVHHRTLTEPQLQFLISKISQNCSPMFVSLSLETALNWKSYDAVDKLVIADTVTEAIWALFGECEKKHGQMLVRCALGYFTCGLYGLTETELDDVLSCNDSLLSDIYKFHNPPEEGVIRIPPLLWVRIRHDLGAYIVERQADNAKVMAWYHRQFIEAANKRYCCNSSEFTQMNNDLADLFLAEDTVKRTIHLQYRNLTLTDANRRITVQPLVPGNRRKLKCLLHHLLKADNIETLAPNVICHLNYIKCYLATFSMSKFLITLTKIIEHFKPLVQSELSALYVHEIGLLHDVLNFSQSHIDITTCSLEVQLVGQFLPYLMSAPHIKSAIVRLCEQAQLSCEKSKTPCLLPVAGELPTCLSSLKWYKSCAKSVLCVSPRLDKALVACSGSNDDEYDLCLLNTLTLDIGIALQLSQRITLDKILACCISKDSRKAYVLLKEKFYVFATSSGNLLQMCSTEVQQGGHLSSRMVTTSQGRLVLLAGAARLGLLEDQSNSADESNLKTSQAVNLGGSLSTVSVVFTVSEKHSVSTHILQGKDRKLGAVVMWDFELRQIKTKVLLPSEPKTAFLYNLPCQAEKATVLCGCAGGEAIIVDMISGSMVAQFSYLTTSELGSPVQVSCLGNTLTVVVFSNTWTHLLLWNVNTSLQECQVDIVIQKPNLTLMTCSNDNKLVVLGNNAGKAVIVDTDTKTEQLEFQAHDGTITTAFVSSDDKLFTLGTDELLKQWDMEAVMAAANENNQKKDKTNDLKKCVSATVFSLDGTKLITAGTGWLQLWSLTNLVWQPDKTFAVANLTCGDVAFVAQNTCILGFDRSQGKTIFVAINQEDNAAVNQLNEEFSSSVIGFDCNATFSEAVVLRKVANSLSICRVQFSSTISQFSKSNIIESKVPCPMELVSLDRCFALSSSVVLTIKEDLKNLTRKLYIVSDGQIKPVTLDTTASSVGFVERKSNDANALVIGSRGVATFWSGMGNSNETIFDHAGLVANYYRRKPNAEASSSAITALKMSSSTLLTGAEDGTVTCWNLSNLGANIRPSGNLLSRHKQMVTCLDLSQQGSLAVSGSKDHTVKLYDVNNCTELASIQIHLPIVAVSFNATVDPFISVQAADMDNMVFVLLKALNALGLPQK